MSNATEMEDRLHVIWFAETFPLYVFKLKRITFGRFCIEMNSPRVQQKAAIDFFTVVSRNSEIPIVAVQTNKDEFWDLQYGKARKFCVNEAEREKHADEELRERMILIEQELSDIKDGRCDSVVAVSKGS